VQLFKRLSQDEERANLLGGDTVWRMRAWCTCARAPKRPATSKRLHDEQAKGQRGQTETKTKTKTRAELS